MKKIISFIVSFLLFLLPVLAEDIPVKITKVDLKQDKNSSRLIISLTGVIKILPPVMATLETVSFDLDAVYEKKTKSEEVQEKIISEGFISQVKWYPDNNKTKFEIKRQFYTPVEFIIQEKPPALVLEFPRNYLKKESWELKPGITKHLIRAENERGPVAAHILEIDLNNENILVKVVLPDKKNLKTKETLTNLVKNAMAYAGINANYFDVKIGNPLGTLISEGEWLTGSIRNRVALGFTENNDILVDQVMLTGYVTIVRGFRKKPTGVFEIDGLNTPLHIYNKVGLFDNRWDEKLDLPENKSAAILNTKNCIKKIVNGPKEIDINRYVITDSEVFSLKEVLKKRDCLKIEWKTTNPDWSSVKEAISGGPYLIKNGQIYIDQKEQNFKFTKKDSFAPRTAIGIDYDKKLYLIALDGRNHGYSVGLTLQELAELLMKLNLKDVINLDGGGSTTLVVDGKVVNSLSERHERKISNGLLIFYRE